MASFSLRQVMSEPVSQVDQVTVEKVFDEKAAPVRIAFLILRLIFFFWEKAFKRMRSLFVCIFFSPDRMTH